MKTKTYVSLGLVALLLIIAAVTTFVIKQAKNSEVVEKQSITGDRSSRVAQENIQNTGLQNMKTYTNTMYGFSFQYPGELNAYEWYPDGKKYAPATAIVKVGFGNNIILSTLDYSNPTSIIEEYGTDTTSIRITEEKDDSFTKNATDAEGMWNNLAKKDENGRDVNELVEIRNVNGEKFVIFTQNGWSVAAQDYVLSYHALFAHKGAFFWIRGQEATTEKTFSTFINSFEFSS